MIEPDDDALPHLKRQDSGHFLYFTKDKTDYLGQVAALLHRREAPVYDIAMDQLRRSCHLTGDQ